MVADKKSIQIFCQNRICFTSNPKFLMENTRDCLKDSNDPEINRKLYQTLVPEWLVPNVRLKLHHFLIKEIKLVNTEQDHIVYIHSMSEKIEVYFVVRRLLEEHNASSKLKQLYIETAYLFCMDTAESAMSSNFFVYIPKHYYRRYLDDVPIFYTTKACIVVDYQRKCAYRFGLGISKILEEVDSRTDETRYSVADSGVSSAQGLHVHRQKQSHVDLLRENKKLRIEDFTAMNRVINSSLDQQKSTSEVNQ